MTNDPVGDIVRRARAGDQVAMAIIAQVREKAPTNRQAKASLEALQEYVKTHPPESTFGAVSEITETDPKAVQALWAAREWSPEQYAAMAAKATPFMTPWQAAVALSHGPVITSTCPLAKIIHIAQSRLSRCVRVAIQIQCLRNPKTPIASFCRKTAWELGES